MKKAICFLTLLLMVFLLFLVGCSKTATNEITLSPSEILSKSSESMQTVKSFHFILEHTGGGTPITMNVEMSKAEGDIVSPDKLKATITGTTMGMAIQADLITADGKTFMTNPLNGKWEALSDQFKVLSVFDPAKGIAAIIKDMKSPSSLADEKIGDALCYHLKGDIASDSLSPITGSSIANGVVNAEIWIDKAGYFVQQVKLTGKITDSEKDGIARTLTMTNFNKEVEITLPQ